MQVKERPYILYVAEKIYFAISDIKKKNQRFSNDEAIQDFIGSDLYKEISSGKFHDRWFEQLKQNNYLDEKTKNKIPDETIKLLRIQNSPSLKKKELDYIIDTIKKVSKTHNVNE